MNKKIIKTNCLLLILIVMFLLFACKSNINITNKDKEVPKSMTVMVYMIGSNLESSNGAGTADLMEMELSGVDTKRVNLLVLVGGSNQWENGIDPTKNTLLHLTEDGFEQLKTDEASSMGDLKQLVEFLSFGKEEYPADKYALILWDHGNGPVEGYGMDENFDNDGLKLLELKEALESSMFGKEEKLAFLGFDACLMSSCETAFMIADYADFLLASQEAEPSFGWDYAFLSDCVKLPVKDLAKRILEDYESANIQLFSKNKLFQSDYTLACIDLGFAKELEKSIDTLFEKASKDVSGDYLSLASKRFHAYAYGRATTGFEYDLIDIYSLCEKMKDIYPSETKAIVDLLEQMVLAQVSNVENSSGLSLYYPFSNKNYYKASWKEIYNEMSILPNYQEYLRRYEQIWLGTDSDVYFPDSLIPDTSLENKYSLQLSKEQAERIVEASYSVFKRTADELYSLVYSGDDVTQEGDSFCADYDSKALYIIDDFGVKFLAPIRKVEKKEDSTLYSVLAVAENYDEESSQPVEFIISLDEKDNTVNIRSCYEYDSSKELGTGKKKEINMNDWDYFLFPDLPSRYLTRDDKGKLINYQDWKSKDIYTGTIVKVEDGLHFSCGPLYEDGYSYFLMFHLRDVQNMQINSELLPIKLYKKDVEQNIQPLVITATQKAEIFSKDGVSLHLLLAKDESLKRGFAQLELNNSTNENIQVQISNLSLNKTIISGSNDISLSISAKESTIIPLSEAEWMSVMAGISLPESMEFTIEASGKRKTYFKEYVQVKGLSDFTNYTEIKESSLSTLVRSVNRQLDNELPIQYRAYRGAKASKQVLFEDEEKKITLIAFGEEVSSAGRLMGVINFENKTDDYVPFKVSLVNINGWDIKTDNNGKYIPPHTSFYTTFHLQNDDSTIYGVFAKGSVLCGLLPELDFKEVETLSLQIVSSTKENTGIFGMPDGGRQYEVQLSSSGKGNKIEVDNKEIFYNSNNINAQFVFQTEVSKEYSNQVLDCKIFAVYNNSDDNIELGLKDIVINGVESSHEEESGIVLINNKVSAHSKALCVVCRERLKNSSYNDFTFGFNLFSMGGSKIFE